MKEYINREKRYSFETQINYTINQREINIRKSTFGRNHEEKKKNTTIGNC